jgi:hypothetical protein
MLLYAVVPAGAVVPDLTGIGGAALEVVEGAGAALVVEDCPSAPTVSAQTALTFADVLGQIAATTPLLPVRFPTSMPSRDAVRDELAVRGDAWTRRLRELDGLAEVSIRPQWSEPRADHGRDRPVSGAAYLRERAAAAKRAEERLAGVAAVAAGWSTDVRTIRSRDGERLAALVDPADVPALRAALADWQEHDPGRHVELAGPWPPFTFVEGRDEER